MSKSDMEHSWVVIPAMVIFDMITGGGATFLFCNSYGLGWGSTVVLYSLYTVCFSGIGSVLVFAKDELAKLSEDHNNRTSRTSRFLCIMSFVVGPILCVILCYQAYYAIMPVQDEHKIAILCSVFGLLEIRIFFVIIANLILDKVRERIWKDPASEQSVQLV